MSRSSFLLSRPPKIVVDQIADVAASATTTFAGALAANSLIIGIRRNVSATHLGPPSGFTELDYHEAGTSSDDLALGYAAGGETTMAFAAGGTTNRSAAVAYKNARLVGATQLSTKATGTGTAVTFPTLTLLEPGRSWVIGLVANNSSSGTATATTAQAWRAGQGYVGTNYINIVDSNGPVFTWSGKTLTLGNSSTWVAWSVEIMSQ